MKANPEFTLRTVGDIFLIVSLTGTFFNRNQTVTTNESGKILWETLKVKEECTKEELLDAIQSVYEVDEETALADIDSFLNSLRAVGALLQ